MGQSLYRSPLPSEMHQPHEADSCVTARQRGSVVSSRYAAFWQVLADHLFSTRCTVLSDHQLLIFYYVTLSLHSAVLLVFRSAGRCCTTENGWRNSRCISGICSQRIPNGVQGVNKCSNQDRKRIWREAGSILSVIDNPILSNPQADSLQYHSRMK